MENQNTKARLLVVSRDPEVLRVVWAAAESNLWQLVIASSAWDAMEKLQSELAVDAVVVELNAGDANGVRCLRWLRQLRPSLPILLIDRAQKAAAKLHSIRVGSDDYLVAPLASSQLQLVVHNSLSAKHDGSAMNPACRGFEQPSDGLFFIGASPRMHRLSAQVATFADTDLPVIISGEPGCGKEALARLLHELSARSGSIFVKVDCAAWSGELLEKDLFGYEASNDDATSGTVRGKIELSANGTLLLDEIAEMPPQLQLRLANLIESRRLVRPGSFDAIEIDVRIVATSSLSFDRAVSEHRIVPELARQFGEREIRVPPLRERKSELPLLARYFMHQFSRQFGRAPKELSPATEEAWQSHQWPGNLRELKQAVKRYLIVGETSRMEKTSDASRTNEAAQPAKPSPASPVPLVVAGRLPVCDIGGHNSLRSMIRSVHEEAERAAISSALEKTGWNRKAAARLLKVSYRSILYKIEQYQMNLPDRSTSWAPRRISPGKAEDHHDDQKHAMGIILGGSARGAS